MIKIEKEKSSDKSPTHQRSFEVINHQFFENKLLTVKETAIFLNQSTRTVYRLVNRRAIPYKKIGRSVRFYLPDLVTWARKE